MQDAQILAPALATDGKVTRSVALTVLSQRFGPRKAPIGYLSGRTQMRNAIAEQTGCSLSHADKLVSDLVASGHLVYQGDDYSPGHLPSSWEVVAA